jgi:hypothetical protein
MENFKRMKSKFDSKCPKCGNPIVKDSYIKYYFEMNLAIHDGCESSSTPQKMEIMDMFISGEYKGYPLRNVINMDTDFVNRSIITEQIILAPSAQEYFKNKMYR